MVLAKPIFDYVDTLVHASARNDALEAARHRAFIAPRVIASVVALAIFPIYIVASGAPGAIEALILGWFAAPLFFACLLSRTGRLEQAQAASTICLAGLGAAIAAAAGGINSFAAVWLVFVPLEAAFSGKPRLVAFAFALTLASAGALIVAQSQGLLPAPQIASFGLMTGGLLSAVVYATALSLAAQSLAGATADGLRAKDDRYELLSQQMTDAVTRHGRNGAVLFASPATAALFRSNIGDLLGGGILDRVHAADRRTYVGTLVDTFEFGHERSVEFRVLRETNTAHAAEITWVEMRCRRIDRRDRRQTGQDVIAVMRDITTQKEQAAIIADLCAVIDEANAASTTLLSLVSRERTQEKRQPHVAPADNRVKSSA